MPIVARMLTLEQDGFPGFMAHPEGPGPRPGVLMVHHAHGVTADYKIDAYRLAQLGFNVLVPSFFNMFGVAGTNHIGAGAELQAKHGDTEFLGKMEEAWHYLTGRMNSDPVRTACIGRSSFPSPPIIRRSAPSSFTIRRCATSRRPRIGRATPSSWPRP
jgi:dienelactone hydrolase